MIGRERASCSAVEPVVAVQTQLLRAQLPELVLRPGTSVVARVLSRGEAHGVLVIAGIPLTATLPADVGAKGETLRLSVSEVTPERVTLHLDQAVAVPTPPAADPRRATARVQVSEQPRTARVGDEECASVALSFTSEALGRLDLRLEVGASIVRAAVEAPAGRAYELADAAAEHLRDGLRARTGLEAEVRVTPRREPLDVYA
jgi:hypothetical protein